MDVDIQAVSTVKINMTAASGVPPDDEAVNVWVTNILAGIVQLVAHYLNIPPGPEIPDTMDCKFTYGIYEITIHVGAALREEMKVGIVD